MKSADGRRHRKNYNEPGHAHELTFSCFHGYPFLSKDRCRQWFADSVDTARQQLDFDVWAYVIMPEHIHIIVRPRQDTYDIAKIRNRLKLPVARKAMAYLRRESSAWLERLQVRKGRKTRYQFWQKGGGYDRNIVEPSTLETMVEYIHKNPVRRKLVDRAPDWEWSSAATFESGTMSPLRTDPIPPEWTT